MMNELGYCSGIENYPVSSSGRGREPPPTLFDDYLPADGLLVIDEPTSRSQIGGMYRGDRARETLVEHGFRLPSALDNRPMKFEEFEALAPQTILRFGDAGQPRAEKSGDEVVDRGSSGTGLLDPVIEVRPAATQVDDLLSEIRARSAINERAGHHVDQTYGGRPDRISGRTRREGALSALGYRYRGAWKLSATCVWASLSWWGSTCCERV